jgi:hypothetical protein
MTGEIPMAYLTKKQQRELFIDEFLRRLREAPPGTRVYMRVGDVFRDADVSALTNCGPLARPRWSATMTTMRGRRHVPVIKLMPKSGIDSDSACLAHPFQFGGEGLACVFDVHDRRRRPGRGNNKNER